jgi:hypothetical protein
MFEIDAVSKPGIALVQLGAPVTRVLQRRASDAYLTALEAWVRNSSATWTEPSATDLDRPRTPGLLPLELRSGCLGVCSSGAAPRRR